MKRTPVTHEHCNRVTYGPGCSPGRWACPNRYKNPPPKPCVRCKGMYPFLAMGLCGDCLRDPATFTETL